MNNVLKKELTDGEILEKLTDDWIKEKALEKRHNMQRLQVEESILKLVTLKKGANTIATGLKITCNEKKKWDQVGLAKIYNDMTDKKNFPFLFEATPVTAHLKVVQDTLPDLWKEIETALTIEPSKPSFSYKE